MLRVPNCPDGKSKLTLFEPTKLCAIFTIVSVNEISPKVTGDMFYYLFEQCAATLVA